MIPSLFYEKRTRIFIVIALLCCVVVGVPVYLMYQNIKNLVIEELGKDAKDIAVTTATFIEEDIAPYRQLVSVQDYTSGNYDDAYYQQMLLLFQKLKLGTGADFIFTEKKLSETEVVYILDGEKPETENFSPIGTVDGMSEIELQAFNEGVVIATGMIQDAVWGDYLTGFAPIKDPDSGEVLGLVGVDFSLDYVQDLIKGITIFSILFAISLSVLISIVFYKLIDSRLKAIETDLLTGLSSKLHHDWQLVKALLHAEETDRVCSLAMLDVDDIRAINDRFGHLTGDIVLKKVAHAIRSNTRTGDICSRYGGDKYAIIMPDTDQKEAAIICERIHDKLKHIDLGRSDIILNAITLSIGIAEWQPRIDAEELTSRADHAMYLSKESGKNQTTIWTTKYA